MFKFKDLVIWTLPLIIGILFILIWLFLIQPFYLQGYIDSITQEKIEDLSKTLIQTNGILVSFIAISGFYFLGKMGDFNAKIGLAYNQALTQCEKGRRTAYKLSNTITESSVTLQSCKKCKKTKTCFSEASKILEETAKIAGTTNDAFVEQYLRMEKIADLSNKLSFSDETTVVIQFVLTIIYFFLSIVSSIIAYLASDSGMLSTSVNFVIFGIIFTMITWILSFWTIRGLRKEIRNIIDYSRSVTRKIYFLLSLEDAIKIHIFILQECKKE